MTPNRLTEPLRNAARGVRHRLALAADRAVVRKFSVTLDSGALRQTDFVLDGAAFQYAAGIARVWAEVLPRWSAGGFAQRVTVIDRAGTAPRLDGFQYVDAPAVRATNNPAQVDAIDAVCGAVGARGFISTLYTHASAVRCVQPVYDMTPEVLGFDLSLPMWREKDAALRAASSFVCISESTAADLRGWIGVGASDAAPATPPLTVAHLGVSQPFSPLSEEDRARAAVLCAQLGLPARFYVFIGHRDHYKNADLLFRAARQLLAGGDREFGLLMLGGGRALEPAFADVAQEIPVVTTRIGDDDLRLAYGVAAGLTYPSRYEGFGLPLLEAMTCGCPVITCSNSSIPEVAGNAALYVEEDDATGMADAMHAVLDPAMRERLVTAGAEQAAKYSWDDFPAAVARALDTL